MMHDNDYQEIYPASEFGSCERKDAKDYWSSIKPYSQSAASWSSDLAKKICTLNPKSVFEFGCNSGKNLLEIDRLSQRKISCYGVDINESAIALAQASGLRAAVGS